VVTAGRVALLLPAPRPSRRVGAGLALVLVRGLGSPGRLGLLVGASVASELLFASALGAFALSLGSRAGLDQLLLVNVSVSLLAGVLPVPGGIGVAECSPRARSSFSAC
jgi:uncharacterized membrane protein YbhN (UPF0104 family)